MLLRPSRRTARIALSGALLVGATPATAAAARAMPVQRFPGSSVGRTSVASSGSLRAVRGEILVQFRAGAGASARRAFATSNRARVVARAPSLDVAVVRPRSGARAGALLRRYLADPAVRFAEPNLPRVPLGVPVNDPRFPQQWGLDNTGQPHRIADPPPRTRTGTPDADIDAPEAWASETGATVVAVLDTGVDLDHPDLAANIWSNPGEIPSNDTDDDANGYVDDVNGWDFKADDNDPNPARGTANAHGTHVAGIIAAERNNSEGGSGVCPDCLVMPLRFGFDLAGEVQAIAYAADNGASILNASFTGPVWSDIERSAIQQAGDAGLLVVAAAGNSAADNDMFLGGRPPASPTHPASYTLANILAVAASNDRDQYGYLSGCDASFARHVCLFTNWGHDSIDVAAPGVDILSTVPPAEGSYALFDGTSMAAPMAAGVAALVKSANPADTPVEVKNAVMNSVDHPDALTQLPLFRGRPARGRFTRTGGRVNALAALTASTADATPLTDGNVDGARPLARNVRGRVSWPADVNDVYLKSLSRGRTYQIALNGPRRRDYDLWIWKPGTQEIWQLSSGCFGPGACPLVKSSSGPSADEAVTFTARRTGDYIVQVESFLSNGRYRLHVARGRAARR